MITHDARRSLSRGNNPVPSPWQATLKAGGAPTFSQRAVPDLSAAGSHMGDDAVCTCISTSSPHHLHIIS